MGILDLWVTASRDGFPIGWGSAEVGCAQKLTSTIGDHVMPLPYGEEPTWPLTTMWRGERESVRGRRSSDAADDQ